MCGRFAQTTDPDDLVRLFQLIGRPSARKRFNLAPTMSITAVRHSPSGRIAQHTRWGLVPSWAPDLRSGANMINARSETVFEKRSFARLARTQRCVIPASGFYEWRDTPAGKLPTLFQPAEGGALRLAGLFSTWADDTGEITYTSTILTTEANRTMRPFHHRMPVLLDGDGANQWLDATLQDPSKLTHLFQSAPESALRLRALTTRVNRVVNDDPQCWDPYIDSE